MISGFNHITLNTAKVPADVLASITANKKPTVVEYQGSVFMLTFDGTNWSSHNAKIDGDDFILEQVPGGGATSPFVRLPENVEAAIMSAEHIINDVYNAFLEVLNSGKPALVCLPTEFFNGNYSSVTREVNYGWYVMNVASNIVGVDRVLSLSTIGMATAGDPIYEMTGISLFVKGSTPNYLDICAR